MLESLLNKVSGLRACNFTKKRLQHLCFPVNIVIFLRTLVFSCEYCDIFKNPCVFLWILWNFWRTSASGYFCTWFHARDFDESQIPMSTGGFEFQSFQIQCSYPCTKKKFPLRIFSVNMTKSSVSCGFGHIYWINP